MKFLAEITELKQKKTASLDNEYSIRLVTDDNSIMALSAIPGDVVVRVIIEPNDQRQEATTERENT